MIQNRPVIVTGSSGGGCGCVTMAATVVGIISGIITIIVFFFSDRETFFQAVADFWSNTFLGQVLPGVSDFFDTISIEATKFGTDNPAVVWLSAIGILALLSVGAFFFAGEQSEGGCGMLLVGWLAGLPFVLVWIWLFSNVATGGGIGVFLVSYALLMGAAIRFGGEGSLL